MPPSFHPMDDDNNNWNWLFILIINPKSLNECLFLLLIYNLDFNWSFFDLFVNSVVLSIAQFFSIGSLIAHSNCTHPHTHPAPKEKVFLSFCKVKCCWINNKVTCASLTSLFAHFDHHLQDLRASFFQASSLFRLIFAFETWKSCK